MKEYIVNLIAVPLVIILSLLSLYGGFRAINHHFEVIKEQKIAEDWGRWKEGCRAAPTHMDRLCLPN